MGRNQIHKELLNSPDAAATTLMLIAADRFGVDPQAAKQGLFTWDPETIQMELEEIFGAILPHNFNKLMAAIELVTSDSFYTELDAFIRLCNALYNGTFNPHEFDPADAGEISWGVTEALLLWPPDEDDDEPFAREILAYIGKAIHAEGIMVPPDVLRLGTINEQGLWDEVQGTFADDPSMFNAIYDMEMSKTEEINQMVKARLASLLRQLEMLQLENGSTEDAVKNMLASLQATAKKSDKMQPIHP